MENRKPISFIDLTKVKPYQRVMGQPQRPYPVLPGKKFPNSEWQSICYYLKRECNGIRKSICEGCGNGKLYDKNDVVYFISRRNTLQEVKNIVANIKSINEQ